MRNSCTCDIWDYNFRLDNAGPCMKHLVDVYSEQLRISLKSEITDIYKRQIEEIQRLKLTPTIYVCVFVCVWKWANWNLEVGLLISYSFSLQRNCDPESSSWKTFWLHEEAEWRDPGLHLDPFCDPLRCLDMVSFLRTSASINVTTFLSAFRSCASVSLWGSFSSPCLLVWVRQAALWGENKLSFPWQLSKVFIFCS